MKVNNLDFKFIYDKPKKYNAVLNIYVFLLILMMITIMSLKIYSKFEVKATLINDKVVIPMILQNIEIVEKSDFFKIDGKKYDFKIAEYSEIYNNGEMNIQDITLDSKISKKLNNQIITLTFYYDYEFIIKK